MVAYSTCNLEGSFSSSHWNLQIFSQLQVRRQVHLHSFEIHYGSGYNKRKCLYTDLNQKISPA